MTPSPGGAVSGEVLRSSPALLLLSLLAACAPRPRAETTAPDRGQDRSCPAADFHHRYLRAPVIHGEPASGTFSLYYELSAGFDAARPTVMVPADAQQTTSWVGYADKMKKLLGTAHNVVVFQHRGHFCSRIPDMRARTDAKWWARAYRVFRLRNVVGDMELIRRDLLGPQGKLLLWGCSGVATTAAAYLKRHHRHVPRAMLGSFYLDPRGASEQAVAYFEAFLRKSDLGEKWDAIARGGRVEMLQLLHMVQRHLYGDQERARRLIREVAAGDLKRFRAESREPGMDVHQSIREVQQRWPQAAVFMYESNVPTTGDRKRDINYPVLAMGKPVARAAQAGLITPRRWDLSGLKEISTEVLLFGGTEDHAVPLSETRKVHQLLPRSRLAVFRALHCLADTRCKYAVGLADAFFDGGLDGPALKAALAEGACKERFTSFE